VIYKETEALADLPVTTFEGNSVKITGDIEEARDDYYVKFSNNDDSTFDGSIKGLQLLTRGTFTATGTYALGITDGDANGSGATAEFELGNYGGTGGVLSVTILTAGSNYTGELTLDWSAGGAFSVEPEVQIDRYSATMPLILAPQDSPNEANYYIAENTWTSRLVGDTTTNPDPSFIGKTIENLFFWKNRLGFLSRQNLIFSEADEYYNFFRTTVLQLLDSAPIDVAISHTKVSNLKHVIPLQERLIIFSEETQFVVKGNELLTPKTINVTPSTEYTSITSIPPLAQGNFLYFAFPRNSYNGINEYFIDVTTDTQRADEITGHVPKYIPATIKQLAGSSTEDIIVNQW
jgi:hypothetical protein